ncbi:MAG: hypothetical protein KF699_05655 [Phycisphaeraceae bacterium]|nr:hypothetical protein [Phycisphaeraceae bacterium]
MAFNPLPILLLIVLLVSLVGAAVLLLALRGRLVASGPHCRGCRFDLRGLTLIRDSTDAPMPVCPECGRAIGGPTDILDGLRRRSKPMLLLGLVLALGPWAAIAAAAYTSGRANTVALKPSWLLLVEVRAMQPGSVGPQLTELRSRMQNGTLSPSHRLRLVERALAVQAEKTAPWIAEWGDVINAAAVAGVLSEEQLAAHARNAPSITVVARPRIAVGDTLVLELSQSGNRVGDAPVGRPPLQLATSLQSVRIGERTLPGQGGHMQTGIHPGTGRSSSVSRHDHFFSEPGEFDVVTTWRLSVSETGTETALAEWTEERVVRVTIEPAGTDQIELVDDEALAAPVRAAVAAPRGVRLTPTHDHDAARRHVSFHIECRNAPVDLAFEFVLRERPDPDAPDKPLREWNTGRSTFRAGGSSLLGTGMEVPLIDVAAVDIVLRPSKAAARESIDIYRMWAREVVIENVPVNLPPDDVAAPE